MLKEKDLTSRSSAQMSTPPRHVQRESVVVIDFGSQYSMLIARRVRESSVYCEIIPHTADWDSVASLNPKGIILSGGPASVYEANAPLAPSWVYDSGLPVLGICYGMQAMAHQLAARWLLLLAKSTVTPSCNEAQAMTLSSKTFLNPCPCG